MNVGFVGLGKLGLPCALAIESRGHNVVGYDPSQQVKDIIDTRKLQYQEIWAQDYLNKTKSILKLVGNYVCNNLKSNKVLINPPKGAFYLMPEFLNSKFFVSHI